MVKNSDNNQAVALSILIGFIIGLTLDIFQLNAFGDIGLGIVFCPMIGVLLAAIFFKKDKRSSKSD